MLLADDERGWQPDGREEHRQLWTILRLSWLQAVRRLRCQRALDPERNAVTPVAIVTATLAAVTRLMRLDYERTIGDARTMTAYTWHWFGGTPEPTLAAPEFLGRWSGYAGSLCSLSPTNASGQGGRLDDRLSLSTPVPLLGLTSSCYLLCFAFFLPFFFQLFSPLECACLPWSGVAAHSARDALTLNPTI